MKAFVILALLSIVMVQSVFAIKSDKKSDTPTSSVDTIKIAAIVPFEPNVTILTPKTVIYDDAVDIVKFEGYTIYSDTNKELFRVKEAINKPKKVRLEAGEYTVKLEGQESPVYTISVTEENYNKFVIERSK